MQTVAVASNAQHVMKDIVERYNRTYDTHIHIVNGASGQLTAQIEQGAPFFLLVSADCVYPDSLVAHGMHALEPVILAQTPLVLWAADSLIMTQFQSGHPAPDVRLAIPNPRFAPFGRAARHYLESQGLWHQLEPNLLMGGNVGQTNHFITTQSVDLAFTAGVSLKQTGMTQYGVFHYPDNTLTLPLCALVLKTNPEEGIRLIDFIQRSCSDILQEHGYTLN